MTCKERILSNDYLDIITDVLIPEEYNYEFPFDYCYHAIEGEMGVLYANRSELLGENMSNQSYSFLPKVYGLMIEPTYDYNTLALVDTGILATQASPLNLTGRRVTIGIIDTGVRYQNDIFRDLSGRTRITAIWDQTIQDGIPPEGFEYGTEYTRDMINDALESENPLSIVPSTDENGHGTAMASVAAGGRINRGDARFIGAAPDCNIVVVKLKEAKPYLREYYQIADGVPCYQENDIMLAIQYMQRFVRNLYSPLVICIGLGTSLGDHAGNSMLERYMEILMNQKSRAFVVAAGNEGNSAHHYRGTVTRTEPYKNVELRVGSREKGFVMDFWGGVPFLYTVTVRTPGGESIEWVNPRIRKPQEYTFVFDRTRLIIEYFLVEQSSGAELIRFKFINPTEGVWTIRVNAEREVIDGTFDIWLPISQFISQETYFLEPDPYATLTSPAYARRATTVTVYNDRNDSLYGNVSRGYGRDGFVKPDIAAPGVDVATILGDRTGSSIAAALTAGAAAQIMQWAVVESNDVFIDSEGIRNYFIRGAVRENSLTYPNRDWGYGRLNVENIFNFLAGI